MDKRDRIDAFGAISLIGFSVLLGFNQVVIKVVNEGLQPVFDIELEHLALGLDDEAHRALDLVSGDRSEAEAGRMARRGRGGRDLRFRVSAAIHRARSDDRRSDERDLLLHAGLDGAWRASLDASGPVARGF